jgi:hypothetical protein
LLSATPFSLLLPPAQALYSCDTARVLRLSLLVSATHSSQRITQNRHSLLSSGRQFKLHYLYLFAYIDNLAVNTSLKNPKQKLKLLQAIKLLGEGGHMLNLKITAPYLC